MATVITIILVVRGRRTMKNKKQKTKAKIRTKTKPKTKNKKHTKKTRRHPLSLPAVWRVAPPSDSIPLRGHLPIIESGGGPRLYLPRDPKHMKIRGLRPVVGDFVFPWAPVGPLWAPVGPRGPPLAFVGPRWPPWAPVGPRGPPLAPVGPRGPPWAAVCPRWPRGPP